MHSLGTLAVAGGQAGDFNLLVDLAVILCVAAATTVIFQRIKQPVVLGYLLAGMVVGPHLPIPIFANEEVAHTLSELGVILLMFSLGLEFNLRRLGRIAGTAGVIAIIQCSLMLLLGHLAGNLLGWTDRECWFAAAIVTISSTTIIVKAFEERGITGELAELVFGILIFEDLIGIFLLAVLTAVGSGANVSLHSLALTTGKLAAFIVGLLVVGMLVIPRMVRLVVALGRNETTIVASVGLCFGFALLARGFGYSVALGAFVGGALVSESGESKTIEHLIEPVRDVFAAVFFVSVGMLIDPVLIARHWLAVVVLTLVVVVGKLLGVSVGSFIAGLGIRTSIRAGMSLAQIGEFSFILAGLGLSLGATGTHLYPIAVAVSALTTLLTPWLIGASDGLAAAVDRRLPHSIQTYASLYGSWLAGLKAAPDRETSRSKIRRLVGRLCLDLTMIAAIAIGASLATARAIETAQRLTGFPSHLTRALLVVATLAVLVPFILGAVRLARALGFALASEALPADAGGLDLAAAPRRALLVSLQIAVLLVAGGPLMVVVQPFYPAVPGAVVLFAFVLVLVYPLWRSADNLEGHVRAGAQVMLEALLAQNQTLAQTQTRTLIPGLGDACLTKLQSGWPAVGRSLKQIALRGRSGSTVVAIRRGDGSIIYPTAEEVLREGDTLVLTGTADSVRGAKRILAGNAADPVEKNAD
jgi:monovalent cation:H+ antiporter-2, CPA2 family